MLRKATLLTSLLLAVACGNAPKEEEPAPAISMSAADSLIPGQLARGAALQTEIRSAGNECNQVIRTSREGAFNGGDVWDAECSGGTSYRITSQRDGSTDVEECDALEARTGSACFE